MFLDIDGVKLFTLDFGTGPRTLLAHSGWVGNFEDWIATLAPISKRWRTVVYDHRGTGETTVPVERITPQALVDDIFRVLDSLRIDKCIVAGFSLGTRTVMRAVLRDPSRFEGLVLMNGNGGIADPAVPKPPVVPPSQWPGEGHDAHLRWFAEGCTPEPHSEHIRRWAMNILRRAEPEAAERLITMFATDAQPPLERPAALAKLAIPVLLIHGRQDARVSTSAMQYAASLIPGSHLEILDDTGHLPAMSQPDRVAKLILEYFEAPAH